MSKPEFIIGGWESETFILPNGEYVSYPRELEMTEEDVYYDNDEDFQDWIWNND